MPDNVEIQGLEFKVVGDTEDACKGVNKLTASLSKLKSATKGGLGLSSVITNELSGLGQIKGVTQTLKSVKDAAAGASSGMNDVGKATEEAAESTNVFRKAAGALAKGTLRATLWSMKQIFVKPFSVVGRVIGGAAEKLGHFLSSLKRIAMYRAVRFILSSIVSSIKEGSENLYNYSKLMGTSFHNSLDRLTTDALYLKNSFAAVIAPLVNAMAPALDYVTEKVATLLNYISQLFAKLSGATSYSKAVKAATKYSDSVSSAADKTKNFTAGFDELNVFDPNSGNGSATATNFGAMFEEVAIDSEIGNFADRLKTAFKDGDWKGLGRLLSDKVNGLIGGIDFAAAGTGLVNGISSALEAVFGFVGGLNGREIIDGLLTFLKSAFNETSNRLGEIEWRRLGSNLYSSLKDTITGVDFKGAAKSFFRLLGSALGSAVGFLGSFCGSVWADIKAYFTGKIEECGGDIPAGLWKGIKDGFKNVVSWIKENMVDPFVEGFKKCFGIHSPSTVMEELGGYVVQGFFKGIEKFSSFLYKVEEWANAVVEWFRKGEDGKGIVENFKELATNIVTGFKDKVGTTYHTVKTNVTTWASKVREWYTNSSFGGINRTNFANYANEVISGFREKIGTTYTTVKTNITTWASNVRDWFTNSSFGGVNRTTFATFADNVVSGFREKIGTAYTTVKSNIVTWASNVKTWFTSSSYGGVNSTNFSTYANNIITGFKDKIGSAYTTVKSSITTWASNVRDWFTSSSYGGVNYSNFSTYAGNVISGFKDKISNSYTNVKSSITTWASGVKDWFTSSSYGGVNSSTFSTFAANVISGFKTKIGNSYTDAKANMQTFASNVKSWFTGTVSYRSFYDLASDVISGFKNGIGNLYITCKNTIKNWGSDIIDWFAGVLGIESPSKVFYQMADFSVQGFNNGFDTLGKSTKGVVGSWANSFTKITPTMGFAVDTSALKYYDSASFAKGISTNVNSNHNFTAVGFMEAMQEFYHEYMEPTLLQMAEDMRRQADKPEQPIVQIGNRTINDAVTTQQKANGYSFTTA